MLKNEMKILVQLAAEYLSRVHGQETMNIGIQEEQQTFIESECRRIKKAWTSLLLSPVRNDVIKRYIGFQQQMIQESADALYLRIGKNEVNIPPDENAGEVVMRILLDHLVQLKDFLIRYFNAYINEKGKVLAVAVTPLRNHIAELAERLMAGLNGAEMDLQLKAVILYYLDSTSDPESHTAITYEAAEYPVSLVESLLLILDIRDGRDLTDSITEALFYLNFNNNGFCQWYRERILKKKELLRSDGQLQLLLREQLALKSMQVMSGTGYNPRALPVNIQLEGWLTALISQARRQNNTGDDETAEKLELKLTVAQLALLIRLLYEEDVFAIKNIAPLLRFFAAHFMSKKQEHISYGSMNKLYYAGDQFTGSAVRELLLKMVSKINKMFFPS